MLGCHEFCGYYEWTFHFVRRRWGQEAVARLWAEAIGGDSQQHYTAAAREAGLAGLYHTWVKTGEAEACDWTFTLDEARNVLRWDMRQCPSKGFLLARDRNADEDYCDHCMGWMIPLLAAVGVEVWEHEHNHGGQCWGTMRLQDRASEPLPVPLDIRHDARWHRGYLDRWEHNRKQPLLPTVSDAVDSCQILADWFATAERLVVLSEALALDWRPERTGPAAGLMSASVYVRHGDMGLAPLAVLIGQDGEDLRRVGSETQPTRELTGLAGDDLLGLARRYAADASENRAPLLLHPYWPKGPALDFTAHGLPRPLPLLPLLIRSGQYVHQPRGSVPNDAALLIALAQALAKPFVAWTPACSSGR